MSPIAKAAIRAKFTLPLSFMPLLRLNNPSWL
jgi:hypothetical protein